MGVLVLGACGSAKQPAATSQAAQAQGETMPALSPVELQGRKLRVVATTNILGDVVAQVGGNHIELTTLLPPGADPHSYQLAPIDRQRLDDADVIFINGLGLEEGMLPVLGDLRNGVPVVAVSAGIDTIAFGGSEHNEHSSVDPHSWQSVKNVIVWTENIATALSALDPAQADAYAVAAAGYRSQLEALNSDLHALAESLPADKRKLVTDHDSLGYIAHEYGFTIVGTVIPSLSTFASASAQDLVALEKQIKAEGVKAIFVGTTTSPHLADQLAADLGIRVLPIYSDSLSDANGPASTYLAFMRYNMQTIVDALR
jgi:ABC-type Zn uptake system ZnuABC Zn-binding protein ZnuA